MSQNPTIANTATETPKKCSRCGLMNFTDKTRCARCSHELPLPEPELGSTQHVLDSPGDSGGLKVGVVVVFVVVLLGGLFWLYILKDQQGTPEPVAEAAVMQSAPEQVAEPTVTAQENPESREAAKHVLAGLKRFEGATSPGMTYEEYDGMLTRLKADVNNKLPSFVDQNPAGETFRKEVEGAIRDYTAAQNWWKTITRNSAVFSDVDRTERLIPNWTSAKTHIENAEQALGRRD